MAARTTGTELEYPSSLFADCMIDTPLAPTPAPRSVRSGKSGPTTLSAIAPEIRPEEDIERWDGLS